MKTKYYFIGLVLFSGAIFAFTLSQAKPWVVPDKYVKMPNPFKADAEALKNGKAQWIKHCQSCHGKAGLGDGSKAAQLETAMEDLSGAGVQKQTDGSLFYKISEGRDEMPSFKKKIPEGEDLWAIVNYMRTLKSSK